MILESRWQIQKKSIQEESFCLPSLLKWDQESIRTHKHTGEMQKENRSRCCFAGDAVVWGTDTLFRPAPQSSFTVAGSVGAWWVSAELHSRPCPSSEKACMQWPVDEDMEMPRLVNSEWASQLQAEVLLQLQHPFPAQPFFQAPHRCWPQGPSPTNFLHAHLYFTVCFLCDLRQVLWTTFWYKCKIFKCQNSKLSYDNQKI